MAKTLKVVRAVNVEGKKQLTLDALYEVVAYQEDGDYVIINNAGKEIKMFANRFVDTSVCLFSVYCKDASNRKNLTVGNEYSVIAIQPDGDYVIIDDKGNVKKTFANRFIIKQVVCVNDDGKKYLTNGIIYNVVTIQDDGDYVVTDDRGRDVKVYANRFKDTNCAPTFHVEVSNIEDDNDTDDDNFISDDDDTFCDWDNDDNNTSDVEVIIKQKNNYFSISFEGTSAIDVMTKMQEVLDAQ